MTSELGTAQIPIRATLDKLDKDLDEARGKVDSKLGTIAKSAGKLVGGAVLGAVGLVVGAITAIGTAAHGAAMEVDEAYDSIAIGTGATGDKLAGLQQSFNSVYGNFAGESETVSAVISGLDQKLDLTQDQMNGLALPLSEVTRMLGGDATANASAFGRVLGDWSVPAEEGVGLLDKMLVATQKSGIGFDRLSQLMVQFGAPLRNMGFTVDDSIALLAKWEREGVNTELVMGSLRIASGKFAKAGKPLRESLLATFEAIQNTTDSSEALAMGMEVFGARAGPDMTAAIREGRFAVDDLMLAMGDAEGAILDTARATEDWPEKWARVKNKITVTLMPLGGIIMGVFGRALDFVEDHLGAVTGFIETKLAPAFETIGGAVGVFFDDIEKGIGPVDAMKEALWKLLPPALAADVTGAITWVQNLAAEFEEHDWQAVGTMVWGKLQEGFGKVGDWGGTMLDNLRVSLGDALGIAPTVDTDMLREGILEPPDVTWEEIGAEIWGRIVAGFGKGLERGLDIGAGLIDSLRESMGNALGLEPIVDPEMLQQGVMVDDVTYADIGREIAERIVGGIVTLAGAYWDRLTEFVTSMGTWIDTNNEQIEGVGIKIGTSIREGIVKFFQTKEAGDPVVWEAVSAITKAATAFSLSIEDLGVLIGQSMVTGLVGEIKSPAWAEGVRAALDTAIRVAIRSVNIPGMIFSAIRDAWNAYTGAQSGLTTDPAITGPAGSLFGRVPGNAAGTDWWKGGPTWVGERGPEIVDVPQGAAIHSNEESAKLAGGATYNLVQNFYGPTNARDVEIGVLNGLRALGVTAGV